MRKSWFILLLWWVLAPAWAENAALEARVAALSAQLRCLVCQNQTIAESDAPLAVDLRKQVREKFAEGQSEQQVVDYMVARYGDFVLYRPPLKAATVALWFGPVLLLVAGVAILWRRLRGVALLSDGDDAVEMQSRAVVLHGPARLPLLIACAGAFAGALALYAALGTPAALMAPPDDLTLSEAETLIAQLSAHLKTHPGNGNEWLLLARAQTAMGKYQEAADAYRQLLALSPDDAQVQLAYGEVVAQAKQQSAGGK